MALLFIDGFDHLGSYLDTPLKWSATTSLSSGSIGAGRVSGQAVILNNGATLAKSVANIQTLIAGAALKPSSLLNTPQSWIIAFRDTATIQVGLSMNSLNQLVLLRGGGGGTTLATSTQSLVLGAWSYIEFKLKVASGTSGTYEVRVNGQVWLVSAGANTQQTANAYATDVYTGVSTGQSVNWYLDDFYLADTSGSTNTDFLGDVRVQTLYPASDVSKQMAATAIMGNNPYLTALGTNAPGANFLLLLKVTAPATGTVTQIQVLFGTTSASAKAKAVIYSDSSGSVGTLLTNGTSAEVTGTTNGAVTAFTFSTPPSVTSGTAYWIGYIIDTNCFVGTISTSTGTSASKANTYASGAPSSPTSLTSGTVALQIAATVTGIATDYQAVGDTYYDGDCSYAFDATAGHIDRYSCGSLAAGTATVKGVQVTPIMRKTDSGTRTARYNMITSGSTANGTTQSPGTGYAAYPGIHNVQADGSTAWSAAAANALNVSIEVVT